MEEFLKDIQEQERQDQAKMELQQLAEEYENQMLQAEKLQDVNQPEDYIRESVDSQCRDGTDTSIT